MANELRLIADDVCGFAPGQLVYIAATDGRFTDVRAVEADDVSQLSRADAPAPLLDTRGLLVLPGLVDAHIHGIATGMLLLGADLHSVTSLDQLADAIRTAIQQAEHVARLAGLDSSRLTPDDLGRLTRAWLDDLAPQQPLIIKSVEGHSSWFNTLAWQLLGVDAMLAKCNASADERARMWDSGRVFGAAYEELANAIYDTFSAQERRQGLQLMLAQAAKVGLTGMHCLEGYGERRREDFQLIEQLDGASARLTLYARDCNPQLASELGLMRFGGCWCVDGAIGARTAAISTGYADEPDNTGVLYYRSEELTEWIESGLRAGMQVCVHAIGERALDQVITIYERLAGSYDLHKLRPRVDHFVLGTPELAQRAAALGLCSAMQPAFDAYWGGPAGGYASRLGAERAMDTNPVGTMQRAGLHIAGSSDSYITPLDPIGGMRAAMHHHNPAHRVDFAAAVQLFSADAAYLAHQEHERGRIALGYLADLTILRGQRDLDAASVAYTIVDGRVIFQS